MSLSSKPSIKLTNIQKAASSLQWYKIEPTIKFIPYTYPKVGSYLENASKTLFKAIYPSLS